MIEQVAGMFVALVISRIVGLTLFRARPEADARGPFSR
jgi:hypothetical protein